MVCPKLLGFKGDIKMSLDDRIVQYNDILDRLDEALAEINRADRDYALTDIQGQSYIQLKQIYDTMLGDLMDLEERAYA
jgi:hypothetical protein